MPLVYCNPEWFWMMSDAGVMKHANLLRVRENSRIAHSRCSRQVTEIRDGWVKRAGRALQTNTNTWKQYGNTMKTKCDQKTKSYQIITWIVETPWDLPFHQKHPSIASGRMCESRLEGNQLGGLQLKQDKLNAWKLWTNGEDMGGRTKTKTEFTHGLVQSSGLHDMGLAHHLPRNFCFRLGRLRALALKSQQTVQVNCRSSWDWPRLKQLGRSYVLM